MVDEHSATWRAVESFIDARVKQATAALVTYLDEKQTTKLRAQIEAWNQVLNLKRNPND